MGSTTYTIISVTELLENNGQGKSYNVMITTNNLEIVRKEWIENLSKQNLRVTDVIFTYQH